MGVRLNSLLMKQLLILLTFVLFSCGTRNNQLLQIQNEYLNTKLAESLNSLQRTVEGTGSPTMGIKFLNHAQELKSRLDSITDNLSNDRIEEARTLVNEYANFATSSPDSIELNTSFILNSAKNLQSTNRIEFTNNLILFTIEAIEQYLMRYNSYAYMYDWVRPVVIPNKTNYKAGEPYEAEIFLEASNSGILPNISIDFLDDERGYFDIPVNNDSRGTFKISSLKKGTTKLKVRIVQWNNDKESTFEKEVEITAK